MRQELAPRNWDSDRWGRMLRFCLLLGFVFHGASHARPEDQQYDESLNQRFLREAPARWEEYSRRSARLQGRFSFQLSQNIEDLKAKDLYVLKKGRGGREVLHVTSERSSQGKSGKPLFEVYGVNPDYGFTIKRNHPSMPWVLIALVDQRGDPRSVFRSKHLAETVDGFVNDVVRVFNERLADMVQKPEFRVIGCRRARVADEELVEVVFDYPHEVKPGGNLVQGGTLVLDPQRFWCVRSYEARIDSARRRGTLKYRVLKWQTIDGLPVPNSAVLETDTLHDQVKNQQKWVYEYDLSVPDQLPPDGEFTLSAFGLPEPSLSGRGIPWYLWGAALGVGLFCAGVLIRRRARRS